MSEGEKAGEGLAAVTKLVDLIAYQEQAVVSREIISKDTGTVTLFAFDKGQGLSEHTAPFEAFVFVPEGRVEIRIEGKPHILSSGEMIVMPANKPHSLKALERFKMLLTMVRS
jgi:quercetin dioxygenase-like cupin family protein